MSGQIKKMISAIIDQRCGNDQTLINTTRTKLMLKGINPDKYNDASEDDQTVISKLDALAKDLGVHF